MKKAVKAGAAFAALAAVTTYLLSGKNGAKRRKQVGEWMTKRGKELAARAETLPASAKAGYQRLIETAGRNEVASKPVKKAKKMEGVARKWEEQNSVSE